MANNKNNETGMALGLVMALGVFMLIGSGIILIAIAAFLTLVSICAQFKPVRLGGGVITAKEGRAFMLYGLVGMLPCSALLMQLADSLNLTIEKNWLWLPVALGYSISALSITWIVETFWGEEKKADTEAKVELLPPKPSIEPSPVKQYEFATWDDEVDPYK